MGTIDNDRINARPGAGVARDALGAHWAAQLTPERFDDYGPNGLQVEGRAHVRRLVSGVTASLALIEAARDAGADAIVVHHGLFWRGQDACVTGWMKKRLAALLAADLNLFAYHLPLDAHATLGNNAQLARRLGLEGAPAFGTQSLGWLGARAGGAAPWSAAAFAAHVGAALGRTPLLVEGDGRPVARIGWCTGGAQGMFDAAIRAGADLYLTGEISEPQAHLARESGVAFLACGHHATERDGVRALAADAAARFGLEHVALDIENPA